MIGSQGSLFRLLSAAAVVCVALGCTMQRGVTPGPGLSRADADSLITDIESAFADGQYADAEALAREAIYNYPDHPRIDEVHLLAARSSFVMGSYAQAVKYAGVIPEKYEVSPYREEALAITAAGYDRLEQHYEAADALLTLLSSPLEPDEQKRYLADLRQIATHKLSPSELESLIDAYPKSVLAREISLTLAKKEFARGEYERAYQLLADLLYQFPEDKRAAEVRELMKLAASRKQDPNKMSGFVDPSRIGVVLPYTGNYSRYGRYFEQGISLAIDGYNAAGEFPMTMVKGDSKADPVEAAKVTRKLALEEGVIAIVGSVFTMPSVAAAIEANALKVPLISPIVSDGRVVEVGPWVFQTKVPEEVEVSAMARLAVEDLLLERIAVLAPVSGEKRKSADYFIQEILHRGGDVVAQEYYEEDATDFRKQLDVIRDAAPEALFVPGETEELINILPQVKFYDLQIQLLGLSNWNSEKLLRYSQEEMEGALFPLETYHGKDTQTYQYFLTQHQAHVGGEVNPITVAAYFAVKVLLDAIDQGSVDREQVRSYLHARLGGGASARMAEASAVSIVRVRSGKVSEYTVYSGKN